MKVFSARKFRKDRRYRRLLPDSHLEVLDRRVVINEQIDYEAEGKEWELYPVSGDWCEEV